MKDDEYNEMVARRMARHVTTYRRNGARLGYAVRSPRRDYGRRRTAWVVLGAWAMGVGTLMIIQAAVAFLQGVGR